MDQFVYDSVATKAILDRVLMHQSIQDAVEIAKVVKKRRQAMLARRAGVCSLVLVPVLAYFFMAAGPNFSFTTTAVHVQPVAGSMQQHAPVIGTDIPPKTGDLLPSIAPTDISTSGDSDANLQLRMQPTLTTQPTFKSE